MSGHDQQKCPVCKLNDAEIMDRDIVTDTYYVRCKRCGPFRISVHMDATLSDSPADHDLSGVLRNHYERDRKTLSTVSEENYADLKRAAPAPTDVPGKVRHLLLYLARKQHRPGNQFTLDPRTECSICYADPDELGYYFRYAMEVGYLHGNIDSWNLTGFLKPKGWEEAARAPTLESPYTFVAMCFSEKARRAPLLAQAYKDAIQPAIETDAGYHAVKINDEPFNGDIVFEIIARIKESRFLVADVTEHRNGVYYEGGFAMGMGLQVIWTCHKDDMNDCHFDTQHFNHIVWTDDLPKFRKDLANRILATIGKGPVRP